MFQVKFHDQREPFQSLQFLMAIRLVEKREHFVFQRFFHVHLGTHPVNVLLSMIVVLEWEKKDALKLRILLMWTWKFTVPFCFCNTAHSFCSLTLSCWVVVLPSLRKRKLIFIYLIASISRAILVNTSMYSREQKDWKNLSLLQRYGKPKI